MRRWQLAALILAILAFGLAAAGSGDIDSNWPVAGGLSLQSGQATFFWLGVLLFLVAVWGWRST